MKRLVIATRGSQLALWQANHVKARLEVVEPGLAVDFNVIKTSGDKILDVPLAKVGGKGLFVKEIEQALVDRAADLAVHSMKDVPAELAPGLAIAAVSARETPWDALCTRGGVTLDELPKGARVGTSSMRRQCQLLARRPDLQIAMLRGNVPTRIRKLDDGEFDAIVLARAGLERLDLGIALANLDREHALRDGRDADLERQHLRDPVGHPQPGQAGGREHDRVEVTGIELLDPRRHVAAQHRDLEIGAAREQLALSAHAGRPDPRALWQRVERRRRARA